MSSKTVDSLTTSYTVDAADQLLTDSNTGYSSTYTYDSNGNWASQDLNGTTYNYTYDDGDKLDTIKVGGTTVKSYTYDGAGLTATVVTGAGTTTLSYDYENRVTGITYPSSATNSFTYNGLDTRVGKVDSSGTSTYKRDGAGVTAPVLSDGTIAYTPGFSERKSSTTTFDHADFLGTFTRQTNSSQSTTATRVYDAFGNLESTTGTPQSPFGFVGNQGYQEDGDSGLKLLGHRYYDPSTGRFLTRDPAEDGRNWFGYCANNPLARKDANGNQTVPTSLGEFNSGFVRAVKDWWDNNVTGTDTTDNNGNPVRIGGFPQIVNVDYNAETYNGTIHFTNLASFNAYNGNQFWMDHEEGHIVNMFTPLSIPSYALEWEGSAILDWTGITKNWTSGNPVGHDGNVYEAQADAYAFYKQGLQLPN